MQFCINWHSAQLRFPLEDVHKWKIEQRQPNPTLPTGKSTK